MENYFIDDKYLRDMYIVHPWQRFKQKQFYTALLEYDSKPRGDISHWCDIMILRSYDTIIGYVDMYDMAVYTWWQGYYFDGSRFTPSRTTTRQLNDYCRENGYTQHLIENCDLLYFATNYMHTER